LSWPLILRSRHEETVKVLLIDLDAQIEHIKALNSIIDFQRAEIKALKLVLEQRKCNDYTPPAPEKPKRAEPIPSARSGWRTRAQMASEATIPVTGDSAKQLEAKVRKEGGTV
jgi:hypothetical protein